MLTAASTVLLDTLDYRTMLRNIARIVVNTGFAPYCVVDELDEQGQIRRLSLAHADPIRETLLQRSSSPLRSLPTDHLVMQTLREGQAHLSMDETSRIDPSFFYHTSADVFDSMITVPIITGQGSMLAALTCASSLEGDGHRLNRNDLYFLQELAQRTSSAIEYAQRYERERHIALTLQEAALPHALRQHDGIHITAEYRPGHTEATIGGDWYDTLSLQDGRFLAIVGDVIGHGLSAAVAMSKLRQAMQTAALINPEPNFILDAADQILRLHNDNMYATALVALYDPATHISTFASAGHHGPIVIDQAKHIRVVTCQGMMLGLRTPGSEQHTSRITHQVGDTIVLYTDGLIETQRDPDAGLRHLIETVGNDQVLNAPNTAEALVNSMLQGQRANDDLAVLTLRIDAIEREFGLHMSYREVALASEARQVFSRYLSRCATSTSDISSAELIFGELLGNVSRHAPGPVDISFSWQADEAILQMIDRGPGYHIGHTSLPAELSESRRGLFLIDNFSKSWSVHHANARTTTRVVLQDLTRA